MSTALRTPWPLALAAALAALLAALVGTLMALLGAQLACMGGGGSVGPVPSRSARGEIPAARLRLYRAASARFDLSWPFLASIGTQECGSGSCAGVSASGCAGPMQIAYVRRSPCSPGPGPTLWERFAVDGNGDGTKDVNSLADAIFTAARILRQDLGAPSAGGSYAAYRQAACRYYGACADAAVNYADEVMARAVRYGFRSGGAPVESQRQATVRGPTCEGAVIGAASGEAIVRIAERQLGREERPPGSNCTPYGPCEEWCSLFVAWVWEHAGVPMRGGTAPFAYSGSIYEWARAHGGRILPSGATPAPGDAVLFGLGPGASAHVAIIERVFAGGEIATIDGNYANRVARVGPYPPSLAVVGGEPAPVYAYAQPPGVGPAEGGVNG